VQGVVEASAPEAAVADVDLRRIVGTAGMVANWNTAVRGSSGEAVVLPGQDDVLRPAFLETHLQALAEHGAVACASAAALVDGDGRPVPGGRLAARRVALLSGRGARVFEPGELEAVCLRLGNLVGAPAQVTFRRDIFDLVGGFSERYEHAADIDLWLRLGREGRVVLLGQVLTTRRVEHPGSATADHQRSGAAARDRDRLLQDYGAGLSSPDRHEAALARSRWSVRDAVRALAAGEVRGAAHDLGAAGRGLPRNARWWLGRLRAAGRGGGDGGGPADG
jgi:hypothetical protein